MSKRYITAEINIELIDGQIVNNELHDTLPVRDGKLVCDIDKDYLKLAVVERYGKSGNNRRWLCKGL